MKLRVIVNMRYKDGSHRIGEILDVKDEQDAENLLKAMVVEKYEVPETNVEEAIVSESKYSKLTKKELSEKLDSKDIDYSSEDTKAVLVEKLEGK